MTKVGMSVPITTSWMFFRLLLLGTVLASCGTVSALGVARHRNQSLQEQDANNLSHADAAPDKMDFRLADPEVGPSGIEVAVYARDTCARMTDQVVSYRARNSDSIDFVESFSPLDSTGNAWAGTGIDLALGGLALGTVWANSRLNRSLTPAQYASQRSTTLAITGGVIAVDLAAIGFAETRFKQTKKRTISERVACSDWGEHDIASSSASIMVGTREALGDVSRNPVKTVRLDAKELGTWWLLHSLPRLSSSQTVTLQVTADDDRYAPPFAWITPQEQWPPRVPDMLTLRKVLPPDDINRTASRWACVALEDPATQADVVDTRTAADTTRWIASTRQTCPARSLELQRTFCTKETLRRTSTKVTMCHGKHHAAASIVQKGLRQGPTNDVATPSCPGPHRSYKRRSPGVLGPMGSVDAAP